MKPKDTIRALFEGSPEIAFSLTDIANITGLSKKQVAAALKTFERDGDVEATLHEDIYLWEWIGDAA